MTAIEEYPRSMGIPPTLYPKRMDDESFKDYKERLRDGKRMVRNFIDELVGDVKMPSTRILRRIKRGKRNVHSLSAAEYRHIQRVIRFIRHKETQRQWENRLDFFLSAIPEHEIGTPDFWQELADENKRHIESTSE